MGGEGSRDFTCFVAMPVTTPVHCLEAYGNNANHFLDVYEHLLAPAVVLAGFQPIAPLFSSGEEITSTIRRHVLTADMMLCDLSSGNFNVGLELGWRQEANLPVAIVKDVRSAAPFDVNTVSYCEYSHLLYAPTLDEELQKLESFIRRCAEHSYNTFREAFTPSSLSGRSTARETISSQQQAGSVDAVHARLSELENRIDALRAAVSKRAERAIPSRAGRVTTANSPPRVQPETTCSEHPQEKAEFGGLISQTSVPNRRLHVVCDNG